MQESYLFLSAKIIYREFDSQVAEETLMFQLPNKTPKQKSKPAVFSF
jgi:hypothetical protein